MKRSQVQVLVPPPSRAFAAAGALPVGLPGPRGPRSGRSPGALAQLVERLLCKQDVRSSNLLGSTFRTAVLRSQPRQAISPRSLAHIPPVAGRRSQGEGCLTWRGDVRVGVTTAPRCCDRGASGGAIDEAPRAADPREFPSRHQLIEMHPDLADGGHPAQQTHLGEPQRPACPRAALGDLQRRA